jgi:hypothetical protein
MSPVSDHQQRKRTKSDLAHLRALSAVEPATSTGRVVWIWSEIEAALASGKKLREIWNAVHADGLDIPYPQFRVYVSRIRRRRLPQRPPELGVTRNSAADEATSPPVPTDPFRNLREQREKKQSTGFHYEPFSNPKQRID